MIDAAALYQNMPGDTAPAEAVTDTRDPHTVAEADRAERLYGSQDEVAETLKGLPMFLGPHDTEVNRRAIGEALASGDDTMATTLRDAQTQVFVHAAGQMGIEPTEVAPIAKAANAALKAGITDDTIAGWNTTTDNMAKSYGARQDAVVKEARALVRANPRVFESLKRSGLIAHPTVVKAVLAAADRKLGGK